MNHLLRRMKLTVTVATFLTLVAGSGVAQEQKTELPSAEKILQKHIDATGGQKAYDKIKNSYFESTLEIVNAGIKLKMKTWAAKPNKVYSSITADAVGTILKGSDGEHVWAMSDMQGPVLEQGAARENQLRDSTFDRLVYWKKAYKSIKCVGVEKINNRDCYKVVFTPPPYQDKKLKDTKVSLLNVFFDKETGLASAIKSNVVSDAGVIDVMAHLSDYKRAGPIKAPHKTELHLVGQKRIITVQSIKFNIEMKKDQFTPPAEIRKLIAKRK